MILVLGGTVEARELAAELDQAGVAVTTSLAGRVANPRLPPGEVRIGGFGGPAKLAAWLGEQGVGAVVDATHPFAERISASVAAACPRAGVPLLRLERPGWQERPGDCWHRVADLAEAAALIPQLGSRVLLTTGRQGLAAFADVAAWFLIRCVDPPERPLPARRDVLLGRGPYTLTGKRALMERFEIDLVVTKDSGGGLTEAKLDAARERGLPVIVVDRPPRPQTRTVATVAEALAWARGHQPG
jgi:precorrin-6A/cobalt-precorrin-6A reductase